MLWAGESGFIFCSRIILGSGARGARGFSDCVQFYCSVSRSIWTEYIRLRDAIVKCDTLWNAVAIQVDTGAMSGGTGAVPG